MNTAPKKSKLGLLYEIYARRLAREIDPGKVPAHIGIILDGNRRWARAEGAPDVKGHQRGALKIREVLEWCEAWPVRVVTLWMLSIDNLQRDAAELEPLQDTIGKTVQRLQRAGKYRLRVLGDTSLIDPKLAEILAAAHETGPAEAMVVNIAVAYGGRQEIVAAVKEYLHEQAAAGHGLAQVEREITLEDIEAHLYTKGQPDPDLVIRTSGEQRLSGFLLWQSANSEFYFCETYWPSFRHIDFLRALRDYSSRERRNGK
ncbi:di-trans,poly-cis-decaprenylcistransferase [Mobiluncus mulieris]|uniref:Isoprenyl transferase n=1 Tax=Mobiluncus mulieris TaxID=2052 RepID=A0A7Y0Y286_9ACTO|nr:polyprenyl diphosphate synthase [Mobiluncus mulieris]MBB5847146.1 short-chain Z-isoprenyl diphosphate synthase [Mobiluncus mulieris]MCU9973346.1 di-trans,poly-cis-decaprenylcistransferase [Mobiluncus mulieris]MCV0011096.1 di-trans,poly-cis-decaprenylcistransferase [Mobiluncus mulieris]NMW60417.1 di-trans,poly-cis-decaprenylcistransferase [Mobiluncus mulieris]NMW64036.1 di-trans,poly-cis-decaprenylcistransferase [Mobiluncus mulieris]